MKKSVIYLGIALVTFSNVISALAQQSFAKEDHLAHSESSNSGLHGNQSFENRNYNTHGDPGSIDFETINRTTHQKTMEEIISENNQIIESTASTDLYNEDRLADNIQIEIPEASTVTKEKEIEERILQDIQIIDGSALNTVLSITSKKSRK